MAGLLAGEGETSEAVDSRTAEVRMFRTAPGGRPTVAVAYGSDTVTFGPEHTPNPTFSVEHRINCSNGPAPPSTNTTSPSAPYFTGPSGTGAATRISVW